MRIGISVLTHAGQNIWENGLGQNVLFLAQTFRKIPFVQSVDLVNCGDQSSAPPQVDLGAFGLRLISPSDASSLLDVCIEMSGGLDVRWLDHFRAQGKTAIWFSVGQPYVGLIEPTVFDKPGFFSRIERCDEIWCLSKDFDSFSPMLRTLYRCPVSEVPYLWSPLFIEQRARQLESDGSRFGYLPRVKDAGLRVSIMEPNISVVKASTIPMLICDQAFRESPGSVSFMHVLNTLHMKDHPTLLHLANSLDLVRQHKAVFQGRHDFVGYMSQHADAVVSHQWQNSQNNLFLDALFGSYPLIHNSPWLGAAGYYYPDFDCRAGAEQLKLAAAHHDENLSTYRHHASQVIDSLDPLSESNVRVYAHRLLAAHLGAKRK
jgi:hypothetical protein